MPTPHPFFLYHVVDASGEARTSSVIYYPDLKQGVSLTPRDIRLALLEGAAMANSEFDWPDHGDADEGKVFEIFGPFFAADPAASMTQAEYNAIEEDDLP